MTEKNCKNKKCNKIIVKDWEKYELENPEERWLQCPYCLEMEYII